MTYLRQDSATFAYGKQVITACAFIHADFDGVEKVFLPKRALTKEFLPGVFELPGGHINFGEDILDGLKREIMEEFEMRISVGDPFSVFTYINEVKGSHSIEVIYFCKFVDDIAKLKLNLNDHSEFVWVAENEVETVLRKAKNDDQELKAIRKGFELLRTSNLNFG